ncbi:MAG: MIP/aquaporin family protein [Desulfitobacteriaceae bacterium]
MTEHIRWREFLAEFLGTLTLLFFANGIVAAGLFFHGWTSFVELAAVTGFGVTLGIYVASPNSQAHLNPAITLAMAFWRGFPKAKILPYMVAQVAGAFSGAWLTYLMYRSSAAAFPIINGGPIPQFFYTSAAPPLTHLQALFIEISLTVILTVVIFAITNPEHPAIPQGPWGAIIIGITVTMLGSTFGPLTGFAMNPARDFGPRLFAYLAGWRSALPGDNYFWVPIFGPILGAGLGGLLYEKVLKPQSAGELFVSAESTSAQELLRTEHIGTAKLTSKVSSMS